MNPVATVFLGFAMSTDAFAAAIGLATATMVTIGVLLGRVIGKVVGRRAELAGGVVLIGIGCAILAEHLQLF
jgi:manganese efflux pump family protein